MHSLGYELPKTFLLRASVNKPDVWFLTNLVHSPDHLLASTENLEDHRA